MANASRLQLDDPEETDPVSVFSFRFYARLSRKQPPPSRHAAAVAAANPDVLECELDCDADVTDNPTVNVKDIVKDKVVEIDM